METYSLVGVGAEIKFQVKFLPQYDCLIYSIQKHLRSTTVRAHACSREALPGSGGAFAFGELLQFCIFSLGCHALLVQNAVGMGMLVVQPLVGLADFQVLWCHGLTT